MHIQFRRGGALISGEIPEIGEPLWDEINKRLGIFNGSGPLIMEWYPCVEDDALVLNENQSLSGKITAGGRNNVIVDFSTQNEMVIKNKITNEIYARFAPNVATLNSVSAGTNSHTGINNILLNGDFSIRRSADSSPTFPIATSNSLYRSYAVAPNWHFWKTDGSAGDLQFDYSITEFPAGSFSSVKITAINAPNSSGLRSFIHDYALVRGKEYTASIYVKGSVGEQTSIRAVTASGAFASKNHIATGNWDRLELTFTCPDIDGQFLGIDYCYCPSNNNPATQVWYYAKAMFNKGAVATAYESRTKDMERSMLASISKESSVYLSGIGTTAIPLDLLDTPIIEYALPIGITGTLAVSSISKSGALLTASALSGPALIKTFAYVIKKTTETQ